MNRLIYKILVAACVLAVSGCTREPNVDLPDDASSDGKVRVELQFHVAESESAKTRAVSENALGSDIYVLVLDGSQSSALLRQKPVRAADVKGDKIYAVLEEQAGNCYLYVVAATMSTTMKNYLEQTAVVGTALSDIEAKLTLPDAAAAGLSLPLPVTGISGKLEKIAKTTDYAATVQLIRAVARIDVVIDPAVTLENFKLKGVTLVTAAKHGWLLPQAAVTTQSGADVVQYDEAALVSENKLVGSIYCYENNGRSGIFDTNPTRIVVRGSYNGGADTYYGINIAYADLTGKTAYDIDRNKNYTVYIKRVQKSGYATLEQAVKNPEFNMEVNAEVTVTDPYAHDIVTNGKQYLGTTNSDFLLHPNTSSEAVKGVSVATISYTTESSWNPGQITLPAGLTFSSGNDSRLDLGSGNAPVVREIIVDIPASFTEDDIQVSIGNLVQTIHVHRNTPISALGGICEDFAEEEYTVAEVVNPSDDTSWVKVSDSREPNGESSLLDRITNPNGKIYVHFAANIGFESSAAPRQAELYISGGQGKPRSRVLVQQNGFEIYKDATNVQIEHAYVGTFHRWNQTAERVIRMDAGAYFTGNEQWTATIVSGSDFIVLSTKESKDSGIHFNDPYGVQTPASGPAYSTDEEIEAHCQVDGNAKTITGTGRYINFLVGLKSKLASADAQPRYGLIAVVHPQGNHLIYVRQGEAPDYLMRPWDDWREGRADGKGPDDSPAAASGSTRPEAVKFCVYNLTDRQSSTERMVDRGARGYGFTQYPSQGGYYFQGTSTKAYSRQYNAQTDALSVAAWSSGYETCPRGYRRPAAGKETGGGEYTNLAIAGSEARLSLWLYPRSGSGQNSVTNQYRGYLADGYFDRRTIETPERNTTESYNDLSRVNGASVSGAAYQGSLIYNPHNLASIFVPEAGSINSPDAGTAAGIYGEGFWGGFYTSTDARSLWIINYGLNYQNYYKSTFDIYNNATVGFGWSIRCVKDENPPIQNDGENNVDQFPNGGGTQINTINLEYTDTGGDLQTQLAAAAVKAGIADLTTLNLVYVYGKQLSDADYVYLNGLASTGGLRHFVLSGENNRAIPAGAFTSDKWTSITLYDATSVAAGAFQFGSNCRLRNVKFGSYDAVTVAAGAFVFPLGYAAANINLFLAGTEYASVSNKTWNGIIWYTVKNYYAK